MRSLIDESLCHFPLAAAYSLFTPFRIPFCVLIERTLKLMRITGLQRLKYVSKPAMHTAIVIAPTRP